MTKMVVSWENINLFERNEIFFLTETSALDAIEQSSQLRNVHKWQKMEMRQLGFTITIYNMSESLNMLWYHVRQYRYSNRWLTPSVTSHTTRSKINTPVFWRGKTPAGKHPRPQPTRPLGAVLLMPKKNITYRFYKRISHNKSSANDPPCSLNRDHGTIKC
jgi:hypothetical protein